MAVLADTNVLLDLITHDPVWEAWSVTAFQTAAAVAPVVVNAVICAELSPAFAHDWPSLDTWLASGIFVREPLPMECSSLAARAFEAYRKRGGVRTGVLADFFIGAHAQYCGHTLLTRDPQRYQTYFPKVDLICPS
jgi:predicted nucleic acid-binding protein